MWQLIEVAALVVFLTIVVIVFSLTFRYIFPFVIGWLLAILLTPFAAGLERLRVPRMAAVLIVLVGVVILFLALSGFVFVALSREATDLLLRAPHYVANMQKFVQKEIVAGQTFFHALPPNVARGVESTALNAAVNVETTFRHLAVHLLNSVTRLPDLIFIAVISFVASFFMLLNRERMYRSFLHTLPPGWSGKLHDVFHDMIRAFIGTIRAQVLLMTLSAALGIVGMWVLNIPYAVILGLLFGLTGLVPILGSAILTVPWAIGAFAFGDTSMGVRVLILQLVISIIRQIIEPRLVAQNVGLDTLSTLFALYVGLKALGIFGLFLGPIILIGLKSLLRARIFRGFFPEEAEAGENVRPEGERT
ncbi:sporulation integral membrane protein YtvI [Alicyclobacillus sp. ALC3]|nr:sporulation integral membrane protein YtvI [Alicyclobacillus sp. ALC3]